MRRAGLLAILVLTLGYASVANGGGANQLAHFSLVRSLSHGKAEVDAYHWQTKDLSWYHGHYYSTKAPGLAFLTVGPYVVLDRSGMLGLLSRITGATEAAVALWILGVLGAVIPTAVLLLLLRRVGDVLEPGYGTIAAVTAGAATLLLPFATLFFNHALATMLGFAAFAVVWRAGGRLGLYALAGLIAGLAVTSEYPLALVAGGVGLYAISRGDWIRRGALFAAGVVVGVLPLLLYDWWAFGSPFHLSYANAIVTPGVTGHDVLGANAQGLFGVSTPHRGVAMQLLFGNLGLVTRTPVVVPAALGLLVLWRTGWRREALLAAALCVAFVVYNAGYATPFGGGTPGPRFLIAMLPFLALGLGSAYRAWPWPTLAVALPSAVLMLGVTAVNPTRASTWDWVDRVTDASFTGAGIGPKLPLAAFVVTGAVLAIRATPIPRLGVREAVGALLALGAALAIEISGPRLVGTSPELLVLLFLGLIAAVTAWHAGFRQRGVARPTA
jgi:4-amino-4-deoxy-L-arabinose transferase-like glycosyltransferase